jgi:hypothetical protein
MNTTRRGFLKLLGLGAAATAAGVLLPEVEPVRRYWAVPRNAPVGPIETLHEWRCDTNPEIVLESDHGYTYNSGSLFGVDASGPRIRLHTPGGIVDVYGAERVGRREGWFDPGPRTLLVSPQTYEALATEMASLERS